MICERCHGKGRIVQKVDFYFAGKPKTEIDEIAICPVCHGQCVIHCCDGDQEQPPSREQAMLQATECNPNEAS